MNPERPKKKRTTLIAIAGILIGATGYFIYVNRMPPIVTQHPQRTNQAPPLQQNATVGWKAYNSRQFGIEFKYPETYEVAVETNRNLGHGLFLVGLRPRDWSHSEHVKLYQDVDYPLKIWIDVMDFDEAAAQAGFEKQSGRWVLLGRQGVSGEAEEITVQGWKGLRGITSIGFFSRGGSYSGLGEEIRAIINRDGNLSAFFEMSPLLSERIFDHVVSTFKFTK